MTQQMKLLREKYREVGLYLAFGVLTTLVNYIAYFLLAALLPEQSTLVPNASAWVVAVIFAYLTNRRWVFHSQARGAAAILREGGAFVSARILSGLLDMAVMYLTVDLWGYSDKTMKLLTNILVIAINYACSKLWIFKK